MDLSFGIALKGFLVYAVLSSVHGQQPGPCSTGVEEQLPTQCFSANGVDYQGVLFVLSGNRTGALPAGTDYLGFRNLMCQIDKQDVIVPCMLKLMQTWNRTTCTEQDRQIMAVRIGQIVAFMEAVCADPCEQTATQTLFQCYAAVQIDPTSIFHPNATIVSDKYSIIGNSTDSARSYCSNRQRLFSCLAPISSSCPSLANRLYAKGIDLEAMKQATSVLCQDLDQYAKGLQCFMQPSTLVTQCNQQTDLNMQQVLEERFRTGVTAPSLLMSRLCQTRLSQVDCELKAYAQSCDATLTSLRNTLECTIMPRPCRESPSVKTVFDSLCKTITTPSPPVTDRPAPPPSNRGVSASAPGGSNSVAGASTGTGSSAPTMMGPGHLFTVVFLATWMAFL